ncbi:PREDICTED: WD repeat-containing protein 82-B-like [Camelina sativa]|uniref:WD repeat-containing protein 82-B-like n=1 Tax=Camelina sativa TaxID=90675 RepID=A0ABM1R9K5_CAMSA|nr:PREDICTED: WD repeat-containing protein 82-B-like [Camelina sativa]
MGRVVSLSLCSGGECFISGSLDRTVLLWDQRVEKCQGLLRVQGRPAAAYDDQGLVFAIAFGGYIRMFDTRMYEKGPFEIFSVGGDLSEANVVKFSNDGRLMLLTTMDGYIHVLDSFRGTLGLLRVQGRPAAAYDDQGLVFAIAFGGYIRMFDTRMYEKGPFEIFSVGGDLSEANVVKFSNDGRLMLLTTMDGYIHVLDSVKPVAEASTLDATFSPEGMFVVSGSGDGSTHAWGVRSGKQVHSWMGIGSGDPPVIKWAPGSPMFVTGSSELSFVIPDLSKLPAYSIRK